MVEESERTVTAVSGANSLIEKIIEKLHFHDSSSDSSFDSHSDTEKPAINSVKEEVFRL
ncbi:hypothetical protein A2U01_0050500 [Trifolium medium]|uniref:Uncharacterized protein n=1 Tax=Trifolium medium TaxID=97028 RepID=A0A392QY63_9FABA|nr:hypothetical protein [Trifolium medium]